MPMPGDDQGKGRGRSTAGRWVLAALLLFGAYYTRQHILDGHGLVREVLAARGCRPREGPST